MTPPTTQAKSSADYLQEALRDLDKARERAGEEARSAIDEAVDRIRTALKERAGTTRDEVAQWRESLEKASSELRRELGLLAVRAQDDPQILTEIASEARKRKAQLTAD